MDYSKDYFDRLLKFPLNEEERLDYRTFIDRLVCNKFNEEEQVYIVSKDHILLVSCFMPHQEFEKQLLKKILM